MSNNVPNRATADETGSRYLLRSRSVGTSLSDECRVLIKLSASLQAIVLDVDYVILTPVG
ncbi:hypothetical protein VB735_12315 [Halotia wernerae UHCC 0503]|nr:hypothetical protein [Halotia wernerae UHCC 0503]